MSLCKNCVRPGLRFCVMFFSHCKDADFNIRLAGGSVVECNKFQEGKNE